MRRSMPASLPEHQSSHAIWLVPLRFDSVKGPPSWLALDPHALGRVAVGERPLLRRGRTERISLGSGRICVTRIYSSQTTRISQLGTANLFPHPRNLMPL